MHNQRQSPGEEPYYMGRKPLAREIPPPVAPPPVEVPVNQAPIIHVHLNQPAPPMAPVASRRRGVGTMPKPWWASGAGLGWVFILLVLGVGLVAALLWLNKLGAI